MDLGTPRSSDWFCLYLDLAVDVSRRTKNGRNLKAKHRSDRDASAGAMPGNHASVDAQVTAFFRRCQVTGDSLAGQSH